MKDGDILNSVQVREYAETLLQTEIDADEMKIISLVKDCLKEISRLAPYKDVVSLTAVHATSTVALPTYFREVIKLWNGTSEIKYKKMDEITDFTTEGAPTNYYFTKGGKIGLNPVPDANYTLTLVCFRGYEIPTREKQELDLLHGVGVPPVYDSDGCLPAEYHEAISFFIAASYCDEDEVNKVNRFNGEFFKRITQLANDQSYDFGEYPSTVDVLPKSSGSFGSHDAWDDV